LKETSQIWRKSYPLKNPREKMSGETERGNSRRVLSIGGGLARKGTINAAWERLLRNREKVKKKKGVFKSENSRLQSRRGFRVDDCRSSGPPPGGNKILLGRNEKERGEVIVRYALKYSKFEDLLIKKDRDSTGVQRKEVQAGSRVLRKSEQRLMVRKILEEHVKINDREVCSMKVTYGVSLLFKKI